MAIGLGVLAIASVVCGILVGTCAPAIRDWIGSRAELNRAKARQLQREPDRPSAQ